MSEKEKMHKEVDIAFEIYEKLKTIDWQSWHSVISIVEQLKNQEMRRHEEIQKAVYMAGKPIGLP